MKKPAIFILLLLYIFTQLGTIAWYHYKPVLHAICYDLLRHRSANKNDENEFIIKTDTTSFKNAKQDEDEILWKGELYDIKRVQIQNNEVTVIAEKDVAETSWMDIYHTIHAQITKNKSSQSPIDIRFYQWMFKFYVPAKDTNSPVAVLPLVVHKSLHTYHYLFIFFPDGPCQPPDFIG